MASSESCNAVLGNSSASQDKVGPMSTFYTVLELCLKDPDKKYQDKVTALLSAWTKLASYTETSSLSDSIENVIELLYRDTLMLVLRGEWAKLPQVNKTHLNVALVKTFHHLKANTPAYKLCQHAIQLVNDPWTDTTLSNIIHGNAVSDSEALEFCLMEMPTVLTIRLDMLCDQKCEDFALRLVDVCRKCLQDPSDSQFLEASTESQQEYWLDLHVTLLHRQETRRTEILPLLEQYSLEDGYKLVERLIEKSPSKSQPKSDVKRIWRNSLKTAEWANTCLLTTAFMRCPPPACLASLAIQMVNLQKSFQAAIDVLIKLVDGNKFITSSHMYILCATFSKEFQDDLKSLCIELYIRAVAVDLNDLESRKLKADRSVVKSAEISLATEFSKLAELVRGNVRICKEVALTAFSLHPTPDRFDKLVELAALPLEQAIKTEPASACTMGELSLPSPSVANQAPFSVKEHSRGAVVGEPPPGGGPGGGDGASGSGSGQNGCSSLTLASVKEALEDADSGVDLSDITNGVGEQEVASPSTLSLEDETAYSSSAAASLGVSEAVIQDLMNVVSSCRWDVLTWKKGWQALESLCRRYMADQETMRSVTKELVYLNIDYSQFKDRPRPERDEFWGIEKGYENCIEPLYEDVGERSRPRVKPEPKRQKSKHLSRQASGSSSPYSVEQSERKKVLKKKSLLRKVASLKTSSDSDCSNGQIKTSTEAKSLPDGVKRSARIRANKKSHRSSSPTMIDALRSYRQDLNHRLDPCSTTQSTRSPLCDSADLPSNNIVQQHIQLSRCSSSSSSSSSSSPCPNAADHFAPMLSTLNMSPKVILTRTPVDPPGPSPIKKLDSGTKVSTPEGLLRSFVMLGKHDKVHPGVERTMTNLKGLDMIQVRPTATAVHMVQLPNPPVNSRLATSNGLPAGTEGNNGSSNVNNNNGNAANDHRQEQQQPQEEANKAATSSTTTSSSAPGSEDMPPFTSTTSVEITAASSGGGPGSVRSDSDPDPVTLVSTPSVSIFQVAHRPAGNSSGAVLQPIAAVTGFNPPNPRVKNPAASSTTRTPKSSRNSTTAVRPCLDDLTSVASTVTLSQLLAQSPNIDSTEASSPHSQPGAASNGPNQSAGTAKQTSQSTATRSSRSQRSRGEPGIPPSPNDGTMVSSTVSVPSSSPLPSDISSPCRVPLVKYVDLDMVSSPSRPRPGSTTGVRRHSQGSNSNSPDPHRSNTAKRGAAPGQNPSSPALNSPQSPALQAPPSPLSFRKQHHHVYRQQENKSNAGDRLASPSHPSQCSSPFSRPSSRSQDTSPSPSEVLGGSMYPPGFLAYGPPGDTGSNSNHPGTSPSPGASASTSRLSNFGGASPSQSSAPNFPSALPKFGQAFGKKNHFDVIPAMGSMNSPPAGVMTTSAALPPINSLQDPNAQTGRVLNCNLGGSNFGDGSRRFSEESHHPPQEEGLGSKLHSMLESHSLLESALNGHINQSPTRGLPAQAQQLVTGNPEMLLSDSAHSISPLVGGMDSQSGSEMAGSGGSLSEQLREFEFVLERVATTGGSHLQSQPDPGWPDLANPDDGSYMGVGPVEFLAPSSTFSESMDVSEASPASPHSAEGPSSSQPDEGGSGALANAPENGKGAPSMQQLLTVASAARQELVEKEKENENAVQSPVASAEIKVEPVNEEMINDDMVDNKDDQEGTLSDNQHVPEQLTTQTRTATRVVVLPAVLTGSIVVSTADTGQQSVISSTSSSATPPTVSTAIKTEPSPKSSRNKIGQKSTSPVVSPGASGNSSPSKTTSSAASAATSSASPAANKAPQKAHDDEHTVLRVQAILEEYKEQLRNSPDLQNKPAPRRRSNPLPSPNATPKRRKSVQSKVKLLSQHARPADATSDGTPNASSSAESTPSALAEQLSASSNTTDNVSTATPAAEVVKLEPGLQQATTTTVVVKAAMPEAQKTEGAPSVQVLSAPTGIQLSIPVSAVVTSRTGALTIADGTPTLQAIPSSGAGAATVTVSSSSAPPLTSLSTVPISMLHQQVLVQSGAGGVRQLFFPVNFGNLNRGGTAPRYIQVRQVTMGGQQGVLSLPRFGTPITMRTIAHPAVNVTQTGPQQVQPAPEQAVAPVKPATVVSTGDTHIVISSSEVPDTAQPVPKSLTGGTGTTQKSPSMSVETSSSTTVEPETTVTTCSAPVTIPKLEPISVAAVPVTSATTTSVLRLVPTVNRVSLPVPSGIDTNVLLTTAATASRPATSTPTPPLTLAPVPVDPPAAVEEADHSKWSDQGTPSGSRNSVDGSVTPAADEKLLNDAETGVSEFLPCADFMGPGVSPSPCFSLSDSPLGSQNSSPATSPATFQASSTEEDSNGLVTPGDGDLPPSGNSKKLSKSKILKRHSKPQLVMVRKDHGTMEYRRRNDGGDGPAVIRSDRRPIGKRLASRQAAAAAAAAAAATAAAVSTQSPSPVQPASRTASPIASSPKSLPPVQEEVEPDKPVVKPVKLVIGKEGDISVVKSKTVSSPANKPGEVVVVELSVTGRRTSQREREASSTSTVVVNQSEPPTKEEPLDEEDTSTITTSTETPVEMENYIVRPRRCGRLQREEVLNKHDSDACPREHGGNRRRSSVRANVQKKNCSCCTSPSEGRKRTKSEPPNADHSSGTEQPSLAKKANTATSCSTAVSTAASSTTLPTTAPTLASGRPKTTKKYAQRKR